MNPYALPHLLSPTHQLDARTHQGNAKPTELDLSVSRAVYRVVDYIEQLLFQERR